MCATEVFAGALALVVHGLVDFNFRIPSNALLFAVLLGVLAPTKEITWEARRLRFPAALLLIGIGAALAAWTAALGTSRELDRRVNPLLADPGEFTALIQELAASRALVPQNPRTSFLLGRLYNEEAYRSRDLLRYRELRLEQATAAFRESLRLGPARGRTWFELAWTEATLGNDEAADRLFALALELEPHWSNLRANFALYLVSRGRIDEALDQLEIGRELHPGISPLDALQIVGSYVGHDTHLLRRAVGTGADADEAIATFRRSGAAETHR